MPETDYHRVSLARIRQPSHRLRESIEPGRLGELADSMAAEGLHQPIGVRGPLEDNSFEIIFGHRRYLAAELLHWREIPCRVYPPDYDPLGAAVSENLQREDLTPLEEAHIVERYQKRGEPLVAIARICRRSDTWVRSRLDLLTLPPDLQSAVHEGRLKLGVASALRDVDHEPYRRSLIEEAQRTGATAQTAEVWRQHYLADRERITANSLMVAEILERREAWKIVVPCDLCHADHDYTRTRGLRVCEPCFHALAQALQEEQQAARQAAVSAAAGAP